MVTGRRGTHRHVRQSVQICFNISPSMPTDVEVRTLIVPVMFQDPILRPQIPVGENHEIIFAGQQFVGCNGKIAVQDEDGRMLPAVFPIVFFSKGATSFEFFSFGLYNIWLVAPRVSLWRGTVARSYHHRVLLHTS